MARKKKHEEHVNAEAWAIPYGDLVTLLFALFTVMYAMSSVNQGKFRVLSDSMIAAFQGVPKSIEPINIGEKETGKGGDKQLVGVTPTVLMKIKQQKTGLVESVNLSGRAGTVPNGAGTGDGDTATDVKAATANADGALMRMEEQVQKAMKSFIDSKTVSVHRENHWLEIEIKTDILFASGSGEFAAPAEPVLDQLAEVLKPFPNSIRVEGHTDDRPIHTAEFPSNWELSAARAASVVHQFMKQGVDPLRMEILGYGEFRPKQPNDTPEGRNANRRVAVLVMEPTDESGAAAASGQTGVVSGQSTGDADTVLAKTQTGAATPPPAPHQ